MRDRRKLIFALMLSLSIGLPTAMAFADAANSNDTATANARPVPGTDTNISADAKASPAKQEAIPPGTRITTQNWQQYRHYMSEGVAALFEGKYFWKVPPDVEIDVGPTVVNQLPKNYLAASEKYSSQIKLTERADGGLTIQNYQGGLPFPSPSEPHKGWKILADVWFRYFPHLVVINNAGGCSLDRNGNISCADGDLVYRQLSFNTDPEVPTTIPGAADKFWTQWYMITSPEQMRYTASLTVSFSDLRRPEDLYAFLPSLRRYQPVSTLARCSSTEGMDFAPEDYRAGFDSNLSQMKVDYLGEKKVLALILQTIPGKFPDAYDMPLGWPKPSWGKWQLRDVYVISASKLPAYSAGYCYGKRVMYVDKATFNTYWEELYDSKMQPWKIVGFFLHTIDVPDVGPVDASGSLIYGFWDIQNNHASFITDPVDDKAVTYVNGGAPAEYLDLTRYSTPAGLNLIMR